MKIALNSKTVIVSITLGYLSLFNVALTFAQSDEDENIMLEEVMVTARKRQESLMEAPLSVTAYKGELMTNEGISNLEQLSAKIPSLQIGRATQVSSIYIRGIGSGINRAFEQSVGMYIDGVYQPRSRQFTQSMLDLKQIEVLRGPQSTLFGKNTIAGAIKVETATTMPGDDFNGYAMLSHEWDVNTNRATVILGGSPTENLGLRLAARYQESDGYLFNHVTNREESAVEDSIVRLSLAWQPTENLMVTAKASNTDMDRQGIDVVTPVVDSSILNNFFAGDSQLGLTAVMGTIAALAVPGYTASANGYEYDTWSANPRYNDGDFETTKSTAASLRLDWNLGNYTLTSLTGYSDFEFYQSHDTDFHGGNVAFNIDQEEMDLFSQEFRVASNLDGRFNFIAGAYYEKQDMVGDAIPWLDGSLGGVFGTLPAAAFVPGLPPSLTLADLGINSIWNGALLAPGSPLAGTEITDVWRHAHNIQDTTTKALFAEASIALTEDLTLEVGVRYSKDTKKVHKTGDQGIGDPENSVTTRYPDNSVNPDVNPLEVALNTAIWAGLLATFPHDQNLVRNETHTDPSVRLLWQATDNTMSYLSWSQGYKSGGFNASADTAAPDGSPGPGTEFEDEEADAWELGVKTTAWDGRARVSAALFQTEVSNLQVTSFAGLQFIVGNAAAMTVRGLEAEAQLALTRYLELGGSLAYLDHKFDSYPGAPATIDQQAEGQTAQDLSGQRGAFAPEWSGHFYADYHRQVFGNWQFSGRLSLSYKDDFFTNGDNDYASLQEAYTKFDASFALVSPNQHWELAVFGRNLTDEATITATLPAPLSGGIRGSYIEEPRVIGAQVRYNF
jgi:iron complex outermembrane receptor protein